MRRGVGTEAVYRAGYGLPSPQSKRARSRLAVLHIRAAAHSQTPLEGSSHIAAGVAEPGLLCAAFQPRRGIVADYSSALSTAWRLTEISLTASKLVSAEENYWDCQGIRPPLITLIEASFLGVR